MELIKVTKSESGQNVVSAKQLYEYLEIQTRFDIWFDRMVEYGFVERIDFQRLYKNEQMQNNAKRDILHDIVITLDMAKEISMIQRTDKGKQARQYFIECEKQLQNKVVTKKELTRKEILILALEAEERAEKAEKTIAILTHVNKNYTITEIAKELNMKSANELNKFLKDEKIQFKQNDTWVLYSKYSNLGYFDIKQEVLDNGKVIYHRKVTQLGREFIIKMINKY